MNPAARSSDRGRVFTDSWSMDVAEVLRDGDHVILRGTPTGDFPGESVLGVSVTAQVDAPTRRDTERNHTATHLLHAALRSILGDHVVQRGSLVAPDRLRFDFSHTAPMTPAEIDAVEALVSEGIWVNHPVVTEVRPFADAVEAGAMALFGEKYGDEVRVVEIPGISMELCGGTHVRRTGEIGLFKITSETGVGGGVRRIEALTGRKAFEHLARYKERVEELAVSVKARPDNVERRVAELLAEKAALDTLVDDLRRHGSGGADVAGRGRDRGGGPSRDVRRGANEGAQCGRREEVGGYVQGLAGRAGGGGGGGDAGGEALALRVRYGPRDRRRAEGRPCGQGGGLESGGAGRGTSPHGAGGGG